MESHHLLKLFLVLEANSELDNYSLNFNLKQ
jgi:hypothetical protein